MRLSLYLTLNLAQNLQAIYGCDDEKFEINTFRPVAFFTSANYTSHKGNLHSSMILKLTVIRSGIWLNLVRYVWWSRNRSVIVTAACVAVCVQTSNKPESSKRLHAGCHCQSPHLLLNERSDPQERGCLKKNWISEGYKFVFKVYDLPKTIIPNNTYLSRTKKQRVIISVCVSLLHQTFIVSCHTRKAQRP